MCGSCEPWDQLQSGLKWATTEAAKGRCIRYGWEASAGFILQENIFKLCYETVMEQQEAVFGVDGSLPLPASKIKSKWSWRLYCRNKLEIISQLTKNYCRHSTKWWSTEARRGHGGKNNVKVVNFSFSRSHKSESRMNQHVSVFQTTFFPKQEIRRVV